MLASATKVSQSTSDIFQPCRLNTGAGTNYQQRRELPRKSESP